MQLTEPNTISIYRFASLSSKLSVRFIRGMAFSTEEKGSPYDFDYKMYFSKFIKL